MNRKSTQGNEQRLGKIIVFAHTPPPHHGQSYMVKLMLDGLSEMQDAGNITTADLIHVNFQISDDVSDIGRRPFVKIWRCLKYSLQAISLRFTHSVEVLYFIPAPPRNFPIYRDWLVLGLLRPFFKKTVFHWHAAGLAEYIDQNFSSWKKIISKAVYGKASLSMVLSESGRNDGAYFQAKRIEVVPNGVPDPCPDFNSENKQESRVGGSNPILNLLYMSICSREKGLFDCMKAVLKINETSQSAKIRLIVAGEFINQQERAEFLQAENDPAWRAITSKGEVNLLEYVGFAEGLKKDALFRSADVFCFPTSYPMESFGLVVIEAMAYGIPIVASRWRAVPEILPCDYPHLFRTQSVEELSECLLKVNWVQKDYKLRKRYLEKYSVNSFLKLINNLLLEVSRKS